MKAGELGVGQVSGLKFDRHLQQVVVGAPALHHGGEAVGDAALLRLAEAADVEPNRAGDTVEHRGVGTAAMVYDALPIIDVFRRISADAVLGLMDLRGLAEPFFFVLRRDAVS